MSSNKAPSSGTKASLKALVSEHDTDMIQVNLGKDAPTKQEGAGTVTSESLAAESQKEGGGFASNKGMHSENVPSKSSETSSTGRDTTSTSSTSTGSAPKSSTGTAPKQSEGQHQTPTAGGHSKKATEGSQDKPDPEDGLQKALNSEPGSEDDPSRLAELKFQQQGGSGPREGKLSTKTAYDALNAETPS
ncbi:hypothetical protein ACHAPT_006200 [Fusarium lateritium]